MPKGEKAVIEFKDFYNKMPFQYRIFADFESIIKKVDEPIRKRIILEHRPAAYAHGVVKYAKKLEQYGETYGQTCHFDGMILLTPDAQNCLDEIYDTCDEMIITEKDSHKFQEINCGICEKPLMEKPKKVGDRTVRHHCHYIKGPNFECLAHSTFNTVLTYKRYIPVGFHNLSYVIKYVLEALSQIEGFNLQYEPLAKPSETFLTLKINWSRSHENNQEHRYSILFFDTFAFLPKSLENLIAVQKAEDLQSFQILRQKFSNDHQ